MGYLLLAAVVLGVNVVTVATGRVPWQLPDDRLATNFEQRNTLGGQVVWGLIIYILCLPAVLVLLGRSRDKTQSIQDERLRAQEAHDAEALRRSGLTIPGDESSEPTVAPMPDRPGSRRVRSGGR